jgi:hypothetical protein
MTTKITVRLDEELVRQIKFDALDSGDKIQEWFTRAAKQLLGRAGRTSVPHDWTKVPAPRRKKK